jgi:hypothetical protein
LSFSLNLFSQDLSTRAAVDIATTVIQPRQIRAHMRFLSDSLLQGRAPGTPGYDVAASYVASQLEGMGLRPGVSGKWLQPVTLQKAVVDSAASALFLTVKGTEQKLVDGKDYILGARFANSPEKDSRVECDVNAPVVFVGFGVTAPDEKYDDFAGVDVRGKVILEIFGAPATFPSTERAYYSDTTVKAKIALAHGAIGTLLILLPDDWKWLPWDWMVSQVPGGEMHWQEKNGAPHDYFSDLKGSATFSPEGANLLFAGAPRTVEQVFATAKTAKPQSFAMPISVRIHSVASQTVVTSSNIVAELEGSDPALRNEYVLYTAHLDHVGICPPIGGDDICHGAIDNASGSAAVLEIARAFAALPKPPRRSVLFVFVTGEEMGLLGSDYFAHFPTVPLKAIVADINLDTIPGTYYSMNDVVAVGSEHSTLGKAIADAGKVMGYDITPDPLPDQVAFIRSDQYSFVIQGVPSVWLVDGIHATDPRVNLVEENKKWTEMVYHTPLDSMNQPFAWESMAKATVMNFLVGYQVAQHNAAPAWNANDFFGTTFGPGHGAPE